MLPFLIKTVICSGLFYGLYYFLLRKETFFHLNRLFLLVALLFSVIIPLLHISINLETSVAESLLYSLVNGTKEFFFVYLLDEVVIYGKASPFSWYNIVEKVYFIGIFTFSIRIFVFLYRLLQLRWKSRKYKAGNSHLFVHELPYTAFSFGNAIYVNKKEMQAPYFRVIWQHELMHIKLGHTLESFLLEVWCCLFWFNPFVWAMKRQLKELHEYQVDRQLIQEGMDSVVYQQHLLDYTLDGAAFAAANNFAATALKNRIKMLTKMQATFWQKTKFAFVLPVLLLLVFVFSVDFVDSVETTVPKTQNIQHFDQLPADSLTTNLE